MGLFPIREKLSKLFHPKEMKKKEEEKKKESYGIS
jgi:hypothetical protein